MNKETEKDTIQILDKSLKQGFTAVPRVILKSPNLTMQAKILFALLLDYAWQKGSCFPGQDRLAEDLSVHKNTIIKHLNELKGHGLISWKQRGLNRTNIYYINPIESLEPHSDVDPELHPGGNQDIHSNVNIIKEDEYKKMEYKKALTLDNANGEFVTFDTEAIALAKELNDEKSIKYYQKLINLKNKGEINNEDIQTALNDTRRMIRTDQIDGTSFLKNPAGWFVSVLKKLVQKNNENLKKEKYQEMRDKFKQHFITKTQI